jgi:hypothetical protein
MSAVGLQLRVDHFLENGFIRSDNVSVVSWHGGPREHIPQVPGQPGQPFDDATFARGGPPTRGAGKDSPIRAQLFPDSPRATPAAAPLRSAACWREECITAVRGRQSHDTHTSADHV